MDQFKKINYLLNQYLKFLRYIHYFQNLKKKQESYRFLNRDVFFDEPNFKLR